MLSFSLLILTLNIDALSYGIAYGVKRVKIPFKWVLFINIISTILFSIPLYFSKHIFKYFDKTTLSIINGIVLILLGIKYCFEKPKKNTAKNFSFWQCFIECIVISVDAIFFAILSGFSANYFVFSVFFYEITNLLAIICGNLFFYYQKSLKQINLGILSGFIFIFLGIFKILSF